MSFDYNSAGIGAAAKSFLWSAISSTTSQSALGMSKTALLTQLQNLATTASGAENKQQLYDHIVAVLALGTPNARDAVGQFLETANGNGSSAVNSIELGNRILDRLFMTDPAPEGAERTKLTNAMIFLSRNYFYQQQEVNAYVNYYPAKAPLINAFIKEEMHGPVEKAAAHKANGEVLGRIRTAMQAVLPPVQSVKPVISEDKGVAGDFGTFSDEESVGESSLASMTRGALNLEDSEDVVRDSLDSIIGTIERQSGPQSMLETFTSLDDPTIAMGRLVDDEDHQISEHSSNEMSPVRVELAAGSGHITGSKRNRDDFEADGSETEEYSSVDEGEFEIDETSTLSKVWTWLTTEYGKGVLSTTAKIIAWAAIIFTGVIPALIFVPLVCMGIDAGKKRHFEPIEEAQPVELEPSEMKARLRQDELVITAEMVHAVDNCN